MPNAALMRGKNKWKMEDKAKKDAEGTQLDRILACLDALGTRMDSFEMDSKKRKDAEGEEIKEKGDPRESSVDAEGAAHAPDQPAQLTGHRADSAEVLNELAHIQSFADRACSAWSKSAPGRAARFAALNGGEDPLGSAQPKRLA